MKAVCNIQQFQFVTGSEMSLQANFARRIEEKRTEGG